MNNLSIIIPVYNEERTIVQVMQRLAMICGDAQLIYVDDGSKDKSLQLLRTYARRDDLVLTKPNGGKGSAIIEGLKYAKGDHTVIQDADLEYDPAQIGLLHETARKHPQAAVFGSRFLQPNPNIYKRFLWGNKTLTAALNLLFGSHLTDSYTCYKLLPTVVFQSLHITSNGFELEAEICAKCLKRGIKIIELPITYKPRKLEEGKKIRARDAWKGLNKMVEIRCAQ